MRNSLYNDKEFPIEFISQLIKQFGQSPPPVLLDNFDVASNITDNFRKAAVLVPMINKKSGWHILFTKRSEHLEVHRGQVAFPGGQIETKDYSPEHAALRETREEIGVPPDKIQVLGCITEIPTISNFLVTPVIGVLSAPVSFRIETREVTNVFTIPLYWLANPSNYQIYQRQLPETHAKIKTIYYKPYRNHTLWGISANIIQIFISILNHNIK